MRGLITKEGAVIRKFTGGASNSYLVCADGDCVLIDTGNVLPVKVIRRRLYRLMPEKGRLRSVLLTHTHHDHAKNAAVIKKMFNIDVFAHESEVTYLKEGFTPLPEGNNAYARLIMKTFSNSSIVHVSPLDASAIPASGTELMPGFRVLYTPGHTKGSVSFIIDDQIAIVGDTMFSIMPRSVYPPFADDTDALIKSWKLLLATGCTLFLPGHGGLITRERLECNYKKRSR